MMKFQIIDNNRIKIDPRASVTIGGSADKNNSLQTINDSTMAGKKVRTMMSPATSMRSIFDS